MEYSKKERNEIYIKALEKFFQLNGSSQKHINFGLCFVFSSISELVEDLDEINKHKPDGVGIGDYWFPTKNPEGYEIRENILIQAIKETE